MTDTHLSELERQKIIMEYAVPLVRHFQEQLGEDAVNKALESWTASLAAAAEKAPAREPDFAEYAEGISRYAEDDAMDYDVLKQDEDTLEFNVTRCKYAELLHSLGAGDIGALMRCNHDYAEAFGLGVRLKRTQTIMQGASHCDFRYTRR